MQAGPWQQTTIRIVQALLLTIRRLHTTQTDIALFTGHRLSNEQINLPEEFDANGTVAGNINNLSTNLTINSSVELHL